MQLPSHTLVALLPLVLTALPSVLAQEEANPYSYYGYSLAARDELAAREPDFYNDFGYDLDARDELAAREADSYDDYGYELSARDELDARGFRDHIKSAFGRKPEPGLHEMLQNEASRHHPAEPGHLHRAAPLPGSSSSQGTISRRELLDMLKARGPVGSGLTRAHPLEQQQHEEAQGQHPSSIGPGHLHRAQSLSEQPHAEAHHASPIGPGHLQRTHPLGRREVALWALEQELARRGLRD